MSDRADRPDRSGEIVSPEDLPAQIESTERAGVTRIDIAEDATTRPGDPGTPEDEHARERSSPTERLAPALDIDARLTEIERRVNLLVNVTPLNAAEAWADFERSDFGTAPTLRLRPLDFDPDLLQRDLYDLEVEDVDDPALHTLFRAKRDEIARQITALEDRDTSRFLYGSLQLYGTVAPPLAAAAEELLETIPPQAPSTKTITAGAFADAARVEFERYRAVYPDFPVSVEVRDDVSELMVSFGRLLIPESAAFRADRVEPLLHHEVGTHVVTYQNGARQPLKMLTIGLPGYDETQEGLAVLAEYLTGGLDPRRLRVLAARVVAVGKMLDGAGFLEIFESLRADHRIPARTAWSIAIRVVVGGGWAKDAIYLRGITRILDALAEGSRLDVLLVGKLALDHIPLVQDLLDREVLHAPWVRPRWLDVPGAHERLERLRAGATVTDLYEGDVAA
ncbi:MAG TPA: tyrosine/phenylalanine carboxypeptidase domain-containing protein [Microbacterium sp.]|uniref:flavohemoglobin expression-modulating QEGLA motif protein n=1 Tax=Microbacterium sp. TaxID=51671 RepID=UPI002F942F5E